LLVAATAARPAPADLKAERQELDPVVMAEIGVLLAALVDEAVKQVAQRVSRYKDGLWLLHLQVQQVLAVQQQQVKN
jgi:hypothetical protein